MSIVAAIGNIARDPLVTRDDSGEAKFSRFTLVEDYWTGEGKSTNYIDCVGFGPIARIVDQLVKKGKLCYIEGSLISGSYVKNGQTVYSRNVKINKIRVYGQRPSQDEEILELTEEGSEDELPFDNDGLSWEDM